MEAIYQETVTVGGERYRITIYPDEDSPNPLEDDNGLGTILSLNRRHRNYQPEAVFDAVERNADAVRLSYFEHGRCLWSVAGEQPAAARCPWDLVPFAGMWLPDAETLGSAANYGGRTRQLFLRKRARDACDAYSNWCNGEIYGYSIVRLDVCATCHHDQNEQIESCWGFYGLSDCLEEAKSIALSQLATGP